ncbi:MAG TPA: hypothetical protein RMH99_12035 [Sandaracinaceae bacterium LLY-WYZ-13_1]|nr:hypothetical protein [Sandaracinaceae bacterium LLY-WYZ-13_1]
MRRLVTFCAFAFPIALGGCMFQQFAPTQILTEQAYALNDEVRWARVDLASERVVPRYRQTFLMSHREWGQAVQIADADMTNVVMEAENGGAISLVNVSWYDRATMEVRATTLRQHWVNVDGNFYLDGEEIVSGDERLLHLPEPTEGAADDAPAEDETAGDEALAQH